jgi:hypothetical protein
MADPIQPPVPDPDTPKVIHVTTVSTLSQRVAAWTGFGMATIVSLILIIQWATTGVVPTPPVLPPIPVPPQQTAEPAPVLTFGWVDDPVARAASFARAAPLVFADTPAGKMVMGDDDVYLWRAVRKAAGKAELADWYPNVNQRDVGCCVGCGWKHAVDVCAASQVVNGKAETWKPVSVEVIYGGSRVEVGGGRISGDGSIGAWAAEWVNKRGGVLPMAKYPAADLSEFSPARARQFGKSGVPDALEPEAREHPVKGVALVTSWADVSRSIRQGYPVAVCSMQGFTMHRDAQGFAQPQGQWAHCMCFVGVRNGDRPGAFCLNSWGDSAHTGPKFPADMPVAGFWVDAQTVERMVAQGDSYAISDLQGFPARKLDWFFTPSPTR